MFWQLSNFAEQFVVRSVTQFRLGLHPRPRWGSLQRSPIPPSWIKGPTSKGRREEGGEGGPAGRGREETRPHLFTLPQIHISGYAPAISLAGYGWLLHLYRIMSYCFPFVSYKNA